MMESFGIIGLSKDKKTIRPVVKATDFKVEFGIKTTTVTGRIN
jgi:predicted transcriptional regulator